MTILITGAYGFVGTNLSEYLKTQGYTLWALDIAKKQSSAYSRFFSWSDLFTIPLNKIDAVIHLAGMAHDTKNHTDAQKYFDINTGLTQEIYDWFLQSYAKNFIFFSSVKAAADKVEGEFLTEDVVPRPVGPYGESKIAAENYILSKDELCKERGKYAYILRPCMIHGPGNKGNLNLLYDVVNKGIPYPLGAFENKRSFTSIDNLMIVVEKLLNKNIDSGIYNMSDDESISTNELISIISETLGKPKRIWNWNKKVVIYCAKVGGVLHFPLNTERLQKLTESYVVSNDKIKKVLGINEMPMKAKDGLLKTIKSFK